MDLNPNVTTCFQSAQKVAPSQNDETNDSQVANVEANVICHLFILCLVISVRHQPKVTVTEMCKLCKNKFEECLEIAVHLVRE